jgi:hypothetical protein
MNYKSEGGFGTPYRKAFVDFAPLTDLVMQTFISNSDSEDPEFSLKFYEDARAKSPEIRPWIYGQWESTLAGERDAGSTSWELRNRALMRIYLAHALNFNAEIKGKKTEVIPGGLALINLKKAFDANKIPGLKDFFSTNFSDDLHLSESGRQFIGMVIFATLYNRSPVGLPIVKIGDKRPELTPEQTRFINRSRGTRCKVSAKTTAPVWRLPFPARSTRSPSFAAKFPVRHSRLGNIDADRSFPICVERAKAGKYDFKVSAMTDKTDMKLNVFVNHQPPGSVTINPNKDQPAADSTSIPIELKAGLNMLRLHVPGQSLLRPEQHQITPPGSR